MATQPAQRSYQFWSAVAAAPDIFDLDAGAYGLTLSATAWGTATLNRVFPGGILVPVSSAVSANGYQEIHLPAGKYQLVLAGVTALTGALEMIAPGSG